MMKVPVTKTEHFSVEVNELDIIDAMSRIVIRESGLGYGRWLSPDGKNVMEDEPHYHGTIDTRIVREATDADRQAFATLKYLNVLKQSLMERHVQQS